MKIGIRPERIDPGRPEQNGRLERLHGTLKREVCQPPAETPRAQQRRFDQFRHVYNVERPHEALGQLPPAEIYQPSLRPYPRRVSEPDYPDADAVRRVRLNGCIRWRNREVYVGHALFAEPVGLLAIGDGRWEVSFGPLVLGTFRHDMNRLLPEQPRKKVLPMSPD